MASTTDGRTGWIGDFLREEFLACARAFFPPSDERSHAERRKRPQTLASAAPKAGLVCKAAGTFLQSEFARPPPGTIFMRKRSTSDTAGDCSRRRKTVLCFIAERRSLFVRPLRPGYFSAPHRSSPDPHKQRRARGQQTKQHQRLGTVSDAQRPLLKTLHYLTWISPLGSIIQEGSEENKISLKHPRHFSIPVDAKRCRGTKTCESKWPLRSLPRRAGNRSLPQPA